MLSRHHELSESKDILKCQLSQTNNHNPQITSIAQQHWQIVLIDKWLNQLSKQDLISFLLIS